MVQGTHSLANFVQSGHDQQTEWGEACEDKRGGERGKGRVGSQEDKKQRGQWTKTGKRTGVAKQPQSRRQGMLARITL